MKARLLCWVACAILALCARAHAADSVALDLELVRSNKAGTKLSSFKSAKPFRLVVRVTEGSAGLLLHEETFTVEPRAGAVPSDPADGTLRAPGKVSGRLRVPLGAGDVELPDGLLDSDPWVSTQVVPLDKQGQPKTPFAAAPPVPLGLAGVVDGQRIDGADLAVSGVARIDAAGAWLGEAAGDAGDTGAQGETGPPGEDGIQGETGPPGLQGETGVQGPPGDQGPPGLAGRDGVQGETGEPGEVPGDVIGLASKRDDVLNEVFEQVAVASPGTLQGPNDAISDGEHVYVLHPGEITLTKIRAADAVVVDSATLTGIPAGLTFDGRRIWTASTVLGFLLIQRWEASDLSSAGSDINLGAGGAVDQPMAFDGRYVWVWRNFGGGTLTRIEAATGTVTEYPALGYVTDFQFDGTRLWAAQPLISRVSPIDPATGSVGTELTTLNQPTGLTFDGEDLWVTDAADDLLVLVDPETLDTTGFSSGSGAESVVFDGRHLWVTVPNDGEVELYEANGIQTMFLTSEPPPDGEPGQLLFDGQRVWMCNDAADGGIFKL
jgi:hypothetical protein